MKTLLIVDDEPVHRELVAVILAEDFNIIEADNGEVAIELAQDFRPDLIMMDITMPEMNGLTALERLKEIEITRHIPVVVVSGISSPTEVKRAYNAGAVDYIVKPFNVEQLSKRLRQALKSEGEP